MTFAEQMPVAVGDLTFDVRIDGPEDGVPVMLLHGFPETSASWTDVAPRLTDAGLRVVAPDQRGYSPGARPEGVEHYAIDRLADDVVGIADALGWDTFHLVGHDWGAAVAWYVAAHHGDRLRSLTALSVPHLAGYNRALREDPDQQERAAYIGFLRIEGKAEALLVEDDFRRLRAMYGGIVPPEQADAYLARLNEPGALTAALGWYRAMTAELGNLPTVTVPTTLVWGNEDLAIGRVPVEECTQHVDADYRFVELNASHWLPEQEPDAVAEAVLVRVASK
jgi:pimeloyl-ACP methyl ester carboxylesterase